MYTDYTNHIGGNEFVLKWVKTTLANYLEKNQPPIEEVEHIIDYLAQTDKKIERMSYIQAKKNADTWNKALQKKGADIKEGPEDTEIVLDFGDGFKIVKLIGENAFKREGFLMRHCVGSYYSRSGTEVYSLRDKDNLPHATVEKDQQVKGKGNGDIHPKYVGYVVKFLEYIGMTVGDSEMKHLGYMNIEKILEHLDKSKLSIFNERYVREDIKLIDKEGKEFLALDLLDIRSLIKEVDSKLKINFELPLFIKASIEFLYKQNPKNVDSGDSSKLASSGDYSQLASSGNYSKLASSGNYSQLASSGYSSQLASSGNYSQLASSGYSSKLASSGYSSQLASSGNSSQLASSGNYSKLASSGDSSQLASSGYSSQLASSGNSSQLASSGNYSKLASSGNYSQLASSGNYSKLASSGDSSKLEISGKDSIGANIGIEGIIKGKMGCWITLAEYKEDKPVYVVSKQIDGKKIKEDTWYKLKGGKLVEVNK